MSAIQKVYRCLLTASLLQHFVKSGTIKLGPAGTNWSVPAGWGGEVISADIKYTEKASLTLTDIPPMSWVSVDGKRTGDISYCKLNGSTEYWYSSCCGYVKVAIGSTLSRDLCALPLYIFQQQATTIQISSIGQPFSGFQLNYRVGSAIYTGKISQHPINAADALQGYIVSHSNYKNSRYYPYNPRVNTSLRLEGMHGKHLVVTVTELDVTEQCSDYLEISDGSKCKYFCGPLTVPFNLSVYPFSDYVDFKFITDANMQSAGFLLKYTVIPNHTPSPPAGVISPSSDPSKITPDGAVTTVIKETASSPDRNSVPTVQVETSQHMLSAFARETISASLNQTGHATVNGGFNTSLGLSAADNTTSQPGWTTENPTANASLLGTSQPPINYTAVGIGASAGALVLLAMLTLSAVLVRRRTHRQRQTPATGGKLPAETEMNTVGVQDQERDNNYYSSPPGVVEASTGNRLEDSPYYSQVDITPEHDRPADQIYYSLPPQPSAAPEEGDGNDESGEDNSYIYSHIDNKRGHLASDRTEIYYLADGIDDDYENTTAIQRQADSNDITARYADITGNRKEVGRVELVNNELYTFSSM